MSEKSFQNEIKKHFSLFPCSLTDFKETIKNVADTTLTTHLPSGDPEINI